MRHWVGLAGWMLQPSSCRKRAARVTRGAQAPEVARPVDVAALEVFRLHAEELRGALQVFLGQIDEALAAATGGASGLAGETHLSPEGGARSAAGAARSRSPRRRRRRSWQARPSTGAGARGSAREARRRRRNRVATRRCTLAARPERLSTTTTYSPGSGTANRSAARAPGGVAARMPCGRSPRSRCRSSPRSSATRTRSASPAE